MHRLLRISAFALVALTAACAQQATLSYVPTASPPVRSAIGAVSQVTAIDQRGEADPTWIGAVRGGYGNPLKVLHTKQPLSDVVSEAVRRALASRGMLAPETRVGPALKVTIVAFESSQYVRREATADFVIELVDRSTGRAIYRDEARVNPVSGSIIAFDVGIFASADDLRAVAQQALSQAIDQLLNKPEFAAALRTAA